MKNNLFIALVVAGFVFCFVPVLCFSYRIYHITQDLGRIRNDVDRLNRQSRTAFVITEQTQVIDFLESETAKQREFAEKQMDFLLRIVGFIGAVLTAIVAFFEVKGRRDISRIIHERYTELVEEELGEMIGGTARISYLRDCVEKEKRAKKQKILFVLQHQENKSLEEAYAILAAQNYHVEKKVVGDGVSDWKINRWTEKSDIIVYEVGREEYADQMVGPIENIAYVRLAKKCNEKKVYGILYCENHTGLKRDAYNGLYYINNANYGLSVMERIYNLLYFTQGKGA